MLPPFAGMILHSTVISTSGSALAVSLPDGHVERQKCLDILHDPVLTTCAVIGKRASPPGGVL
jgi:hypothetical protein